MKVQFNPDLPSTGTIGETEQDQCGNPCGQRRAKDRQRPRPPRASKATRRFWAIACPFSARWALMKYGLPATLRRRIVLPLRTDRPGGNEFGHHHRPHRHRHSARLRHSPGSLALATTGASSRRRRIGANRVRATWRVTLPLVKRGIFAAFIFAFLNSDFEELTVALFVGGGLKDHAAEADVGTTSPCP